MGGSYRRYEIISQSSPFSPFFISETTSIFPSKPPLSLLNPPFHFEDDFLDLLNPNPNPNPTPFSLLDFPDLIQIESETTPFCSHKRLNLIRRFESPESHYLKALCDRVSSLESKFDRALEKKKREKKKKALKLSEVDRKYSYTAEIKGGVERKYRWTAEIEGVDEKKGKRGERKYQWSTEIKEKGDDDREKRIYTWKATIGGEKEKKKKDEVKKKEKEKEKKGSGEARIVEIEDEPDHRAVVLRQVNPKFE